MGKPKRPTGDGMREWDRYRKSMAAYNARKRRRRSSSGSFWRALSSDVARYQREQQLQANLQAKAKAIEEARQAVEAYETYVARVTCVHRECRESIDWGAIHECQPPTEPRMEDKHEAEARRRLETYKPGVVDRLLKREEARRDSLRAAIEEARAKDEREHSDALNVYREALADWQESHDLASQVLSGDPSAFISVIRSRFASDQSVYPFELADIRCLPPDRPQAHIRVATEKIVPSRSVTQLKSGKLSLKEMPRSRFHGIYQDYVCGCALRAAREILAVVPVDTVVVTAATELFNSATGHVEESAILSVTVPRATLAKLNFEMLNPSDAMANFTHEMKFYKTKGFRAIEPISQSHLATV